MVVVPPAAAARLLGCNHEHFGPGGDIGIEFNFDGIARQPNTLIAHALIGVAELFLSGLMQVTTMAASGLLIGFGIFAVARNAEGMLTRVLIGVVLALALAGFLPRLDLVQ